MSPDIKWVQFVKKPPHESRIWGKENKKQKEENLSNLTLKPLEGRVRGTKTLGQPLGPLNKKLFILGLYGDSGIGTVDP